MNLKSKSASISSTTFATRSLLHYIRLSHIKFAAKKSKSATTVRTSLFLSKILLFFFFFFFVSRIQFICINFFFWCVLSLGDLKILQFWGKKKSLIRQWWIFLVYFEFSIFCSVWLSRKWCKIEVKISMFLVVVEIFFDYFCGFGFLENEREEKDIFVLGTLYQMQILICIYIFLNNMSWQLTCHIK